MLDPLADVILVPTDAVCPECVAERRRILGTVPPDTGYVLDLVLGHGGVEVAYARVEVNEAVEGHTDGDQEAGEGETLHVACPPAS